jgi:lipopolysaccharide/colanic/teichoic acid biosynthesis glycosyltransferase
LPSGEMTPVTGLSRYEFSPECVAYVHIWKPLIDKILGSFMILVTAPLLVVVAILVRTILGPGIIFRQTRVGLNGAPFTIFKFRTMLPEQRRADVPIPFPEQPRTHKSADDPRHTPLGRFLRRWSLDEFPQLFNVVKGEMSLIGPRPELPSVVANYEPWQHRRHCVKPGLTGLWQVVARGDGPMELRTDLDIEYIESVSFKLDLRILVSTISALVAKRGE